MLCCQSIMTNRFPFFKRLMAADMSAGVMICLCDNVWSFNALSVPFMPSFHCIPHSFIWAFIVHDVYNFFSVTAITTL